MLCLDVTRDVTLLGHPSLEWSTTTSSGRLPSQIQNVELRDSGVDDFSERGKLPTLQLRCIMRFRNRAHNDDLAAASASARQALRRSILLVEVGGPIPPAAFLPILKVPPIVGGEGRKMYRPITALNPTNGGTEETLSDIGSRGQYLNIAATARASQGPSPGRSAVAAFLLEWRGAVVAHGAHNPEVAGSIPAATTAGFVRLVAISRCRSGTIYGQGFWPGRSGRCGFFVSHCSKENEHGNPDSPCGPLPGYIGCAW